MSDVDWWQKKCREQEAKTESLRSRLAEAQANEGAWEATAQHHYKEARAFENRLAEADALLLEAERKEADQLAGLLLSHPETGENLWIAGPPIPAHLSYSTLLLRSDSGDEWTLTFKLEEGNVPGTVKRERVLRAIREEAEEASDKRHGGRISDIVERLRQKERDYYRRDTGGAFGMGPLLLEAADEIEALREDAERLDWLERHLFEGKWDGTIGRPKSWHMAGPYRHTLKTMHGDTLRKAIDAAMGESHE